jgi:hypothetical protein
VTLCVDKERQYFRTVILNYGYVYVGGEGKGLEACQPERLFAPVWNL